MSGGFYRRLGKPGYDRAPHRSHRIRVSLGDEKGLPGNPFPARPHQQWKTRYRRTIAALRHIEQQYMHIIDTDRRRFDRERDEYGRYLPSERVVSVTSTDDLGR